MTALSAASVLLSAGSVPDAAKRGALIVFGTPGGAGASLDRDSLYIFNTYMKRKLVQAGGSLAVTLPAEVVQEFRLKKGMSVDVSVHPQTGAVTVRPGVRYFERGKVTKRFEELANELMDRRSKVYRALAK